jgi:hypothetical protein
MRIWTVHPMYLDKQGMATAWREGVLGISVFGTSKMYSSHPQLKRFTSKAQIAEYLLEILEESKNRDYTFNAGQVFDKLLPEDYAAYHNSKLEFDPVVVSYGQLMYEFRHLQNILKERDIVQYRANEKQVCDDMSEVVENPSFHIDSGTLSVAAWEIEGVELDGK